MMRKQLLNKCSDKKIYKITEKRHCTGCGACANACPVGCIVMTRDEEGFLYPSIDEKLCISCGACKKICRSSVSEPTEEYEVYALYNKDEEARKKASSGGIFEVIAKEILKNNGIVFGVKMDGLKAIHTYIEKEEDLDLLIGSKYIQSNVGNTYKLVKRFLEQGKTVLYSGTPCQIQALYKILGKEYENLYTVDFVCHGVSSPKIFEKYIQEVLKIEDTIKSIRFRDKTEGWSNFSMYIESTEGVKYRKTIHDDVYLQSFLKNLNLRRSCFSCTCRTIHRVSDITLGDLWGCSEIYSDWSEEKGYSMAIIQDLKGKQLFQEIKEQVIYRMLEIDKVISYNRSMISSPWDEVSRDLFFRYVKKESLEKSIEKAKEEGLKKKVLRKWWKICRKMKV